MVRSRTAWMIASMAGIGKLPAPGTAGSAVAAVIGAALYAVSPWCLAILIPPAIAIGVWAIPRAGGAEDPGWVVIDELAGQWITMLAMGSLSLFGVVASFALFRLFDIAKPGPIGWADRQKGAVGVMGDDVIAGVIAALVLMIGRLAWQFIAGH